MNYIAHIHLAYNNNSSMLGNFMGDFVKGSDLSALPSHIQKGINIHRKIDSFVDQHETTSQLKTQFPTTIRRASGIILDVCYDYLLCSHWQHFCQTDIDKVLEEFYFEMAQSEITLNPRYDKVKKSLLTHRWLAEYNNIDACQRAYQAIEKRLNNKFIFAKEGFDYIQHNMQSIEQRFFEFYPQAMRYTTK